MSCVVIADAASQNYFHQLRGKYLIQVRELTCGILDVVLVAADVGAGPEVSLTNSLLALSSADG